MCVLLDKNEQALRFLLDDFFDWSSSKYQYVVDSGLLDYFTTNKREGDMFKEWSHATPSIIDGKLYVRFTQGLGSLFTKKFEQIEHKAILKSVPSPKGHGYDVIIPITSRLEIFKKATQKIWDDLGIDLKEFDRPGMSRYKTNEYLERKVFPSFDEKQFMGDKLREIEPLTLYGYSLSIFLLDNDIKVLFSNYSDDYENVVNETLLDIIPDEIEENIPEISGYIKDNIFPDWQQHPVRRELPQYTLQEIRDNVMLDRAGNAIASLLKTRNINQDFHYLEAIMTLASIGLLEDTGKLDYFTQVAKHLNVIPYLRYPINFFGYHWPDVISRLQHYQADYTSILARRIFEQHPVETSSVLHETLDDSNQYAVSYPRRVWSLTLNTSMEYKIAEKLRDDLVQDYKGVVELIPISPIDNTVLSLSSGTGDKDATNRVLIHGIEFRAKDIATVFHNTHLASAMQYASEYNPIWPNLQDVKLMRDMLQGRILPYTFYSQVSQESLRLMSAKDTLLWFSDDKTFTEELNMQFSIGIPMTHILRELARKGKVKSKKLASFLTLFT